MRWWLAAGAAVTLHLCTAGVFIWHWRARKTGITQQPVLYVTMIAMDQHRMISSVHISKQYPYKSVSLARLHLATLQHRRSRANIPRVDRRIQSKNNNHKVQHHKTRRRSSLTGQSRNALLIRIHNAAVKNLHIPPQATWLDQHGDVQLQFMLLPTGRMVHVKVVSSSGFHLLDAAAMQSLKTLPVIAPLKLSYPLQLSLHIHFQ